MHVHSSSDSPTRMSFSVMHDRHIYCDAQVVVVRGSILGMKAQIRTEWMSSSSQPQPLRVCEGANSTESNNYRESHANMTSMCTGVRTLERFIVPSSRLTFTVTPDAEMTCFDLHCRHLPCHACTHPTHTATGPSLHLEQIIAGQCRNPWSSNDRASYPLTVPVISQELRLPRACILEEKSVTEWNIRNRKDCNLQGSELRKQSRSSPWLKTKCICQKILKFVNAFSHELPPALFWIFPPIEIPPKIWIRPSIWTFPPESDLPLNCAVTSLISHYHGGVRSNTICCTCAL